MTYEEFRAQCDSDEEAARALFELLADETERVKLPEDRKGKVYIAGPITTATPFDLQRFYDVEKELEQKGYKPVNPLHHGEVEGAQWADYLRFDIRNLMKCEAIYLLPGWSNSAGARLEYMNAVQLNMELMFHPRAERTANFGV